MRNLIILFGLCAITPHLLFAGCDKKAAAPTKCERPAVSAKCAKKPAKPAKCEKKPKPVAPMPVREACCERKLPPPPPCPSTRCRPQCKYERWMFQIRGAAYLSLRKQFRDVYGTASPTLEVEGSYSVWKSATCPQDRLLVWANAGWTPKTGRTQGFGYRTKLDLIPFSIGVEYHVNIMDHFGFYVGIGPSYSLLRVKNSDGFTTTHHNREQFGFTTKTGLRWIFTRHFFLDVFGDYSYTPFRNIHDSIQNLNGNFSAFNVGAGLGVNF